jgi:hypothetical protein
VVEPVAGGLAGATVVGTPTVGVVVGAAVVGVVAVGATVPGWAPPAGVVVDAGGVVVPCVAPAAGVLVVGVPAVGVLVVGVLGVEVVPCTRAEGGIVMPSTLSVLVVVFAANAGDGQLAARQDATTAKSAPARWGDIQESAPTIIAVFMLTSPRATLGAGRLSPQRTPRGARKRAHPNLDAPTLTPTAFAITRRA